MKIFITIQGTPGSFTKVRRIITTLTEKPDIQVFSCYDVVGFCDVIAEIQAKIEIEMYFESVLMELLGQAEINKIVSFIVVKESEHKEPAHPITGFIFVNVVPQMTKFVQDSLLTLPDIISADIVSGKYDIIIKTKIPPSKLTQHTNDIHQIKGVKSTETLIPHDIFRHMAQ